jgi:hypothetical protein
LGENKKCRDVCGKLFFILDYICPRCCGKPRSVDGKPFTEVDVDGTPLNVEANFCYLGNVC